MFLPPELEALERLEEARSRRLHAGGWTGRHGHARQLEVMRVVRDRRHADAGRQAVQLPLASRVGRLKVESVAALVRARAWRGRPVDVAPGRVGQRRPQTVRFGVGGQFDLVLVGPLGRQKRGLDPARRRLLLDLLQGGDDARVHAIEVDGHPIASPPRPRT